MSRLKAGEWVEVRSREEILMTLDPRGRLGEMPFMPEMFSFCGQRFRVFKRAHKTCDTVFPTRGRRVDAAVHLETRCDGSAHGGCQAGCLLFWKEAWLKRVDGDQARPGGPPLGERHAGSAVPANAACTEHDVWAHTEARPEGPESGRRYVCQATLLPSATTTLAWWDIRQYLEDYWSGNARLGRLLGGLVYALYYSISQAGIGLGPPMRWVYNVVWPRWRGHLFPRSGGEIEAGQPTPAETLNLQPGELVRVKSHDAILKTLTRDGINRGMYWDAEMVPYCNGTYRVLRRVSRIVNEKTGVMQEMKNPCIILDSVVCQGLYSGCRMFCPRSIYPYWREIWLDRVEPAEVASANGRRADHGVEVCD
jgi:hypothetical protein